MDYYILLSVALLGAIMTYGIYMIVTTVAEKVFEKQRLELRNKNTEITLPLRLQAYERMCLFLERISPGNLLLRLVPSAMTSLELQQILLNDIREEYNHNVAQQMYISSNAWDQISNAMNEIVADINKASTQVSPESPPSDLAKKIFAQVIEKDVQPVSLAMKVLKDEIREMF